MHVEDLQWFIPSWLLKMEAVIAHTAPYTIEENAVHVATGRPPYTEGLGLEDIGVEMGKECGLMWTLIWQAYQFCFLQERWQPRVLLACLSPPR